MPGARARITILDAMSDPALFGRWFAGRVWHAWRAFLAALFGLPMNDEALALFRSCTNRTVAPRTRAREGWVLAGRRGGKSRVAALVAVFLASFRDYTSILAPGERATVMVIAADRKQARVVFRYIEGLLDGVPMLAALIQRRTRDAIYLRNRVVIEVHTANFRAVRGYTVVAAICDEIAFWRTDDSANPDTEILNALRPAMATVPEALLLCISSPYARRGVLWDAYRTHFGQDGNVLVWQADTRTMNPTVDERVIADAYARDEAAASAEYGAQFRRDIESYVSREVLEAVTVPDRYELPPSADIAYVAFVDPSGGSQDSMTLAIVHAEDHTFVLDVVREARAPFSPEAVVLDFTSVLNAYGITMVVGDRYGGEWPREQFRKLGIEYTVSEIPKSDIYRELLPLLNSGRVELLDDRRLLAQLAGLERRTGRGGRDSIDHAPGAHDDLANAAAGALTLTALSRVAVAVDPTDDELAAMHEVFNAPDHGLFQWPTR
jgi:hypothetical protein